MCIYGGCSRCQHERAEMRLTPNDVAEVARRIIERLDGCDAEALTISARIAGRRGEPCQHPDGVQVLEDAETIIRKAAWLVAEEIKDGSLQLTTTTKTSA